MISAEAVTNSSGMGLTLMDCSVEGERGDPKRPKVIGWSEGVKCALGDINETDKWSLLVEMIFRYHGEGINLKTKCERFTAITHHNKIVIGKFAYIQLKKSMHRSSIDAKT